MEVDNETRNSRKSVCAAWLWFLTMLCAFLWERWWRIVTWCQQLIDAAAVQRCHTSSASSENRPTPDDVICILRLWGSPLCAHRWNMKLLTLLTSTKPVWTEEGFHPSAVFCSSFVLQIVSATHVRTHTRTHTQHSDADAVRAKTHRNTSGID